GRARTALTSLRPDSHGYSQEPSQPQSAVALTLQRVRAGRHLVDPRPVDRNLHPVEAGGSETATVDYRPEVIRRCELPAGDIRLVSRAVVRELELPDELVRPRGNGDGQSGVLVLASVQGHSRRLLVFVDDDRGVRSGRAWRPLRACSTGSTLWSLRSRGPLRSLWPHRSGRTLRSCRPLGSRGAGRSLLVPVEGGLVVLAAATRGRVDDTQVTVRGLVAAVDHTVRVGNRSLYAGRDAECRSGREHRHGQLRRSHLLLLSSTARRRA